MLLGNRGWMATHHCALDAAAEAQLAGYEANGHTVICLALGTPSAGGGKAASPLRLVGLVSLCDSLKAEACAVVTQLRSQGLQVHMIM